MPEDRIALADEIERLISVVGSGCMRAHELLAEKYSEWSPEHGTRFTDKYGQEADQGLRAAQSLCDLIRSEALAALRQDAGAAMRERPPAVVFHQHDWIPGFAAFWPGATTPSPDSRAFCVINLGSMLAAVQDQALPVVDLPYVIAESMMHEIIHVIEQWAGAEFSEDKVEALLAKYRALPLSASEERRDGK